MKKVILAAIVVVMALTGVFAMVGCNKDSYVGVSAQVDLLKELQSNKIDVGVMDSVMAGYYMTQDSSAASQLQIVEGVILAEEEYGIGFRKGSALADKVNTTLAKLSANGTIATIATKYGLANEILSCEYTSKWEQIADKSDWDAIVEKGEVVVGYTLFAPIAYKDENDQLIGFDTELAKAVFAELGLTVKFQEIEWNTKEVELNAGRIDCIWNGMTITDERKENMEMSVAYMANKQVAVIRKADASKYTTKESLKEGKLAAESGSAGEDVIKELLGIE
ncbi:MAG: transporter substrate-binding domain-containing protein [Christensenellales bacterium]